jgi:hypothetical protein
VLVGEVLDVPLEAALRPSTLIVAAGRLLGPICDRLQPAVPERQYTALLAADDRDEGAVPASEQRHKGCEQEVVRHACRVGHGSR